MDKISLLQKIIDESKRIVFFGGAGVSTESGIPDFRSANGVYNLKLDRNFSPEELVSHTMYEKYPEEFYDFYKKHLVYPNAKPNFAHKYLARLEQDGKLTAVITQNIDCLHEMAGSKNVLKLHGTVDSNACVTCGKKYNMEEFLKICEKENEEIPDQRTFTKAINEISKADTLIIGGTSLIVYPAASLIHYFQGKNLVLINKSKTEQDNFANLSIHESIGEVFKKLK